MKIAIFLVVLVGVNIIVAWILQFYFNESILGNMSFVPSDPSFLSIPQLPPALGQHFFGDYEQYVGFARSAATPYPTPAPGVLTAAYGPVAIVLAKVLDGIFGWPKEAFVFLIACLVLFYVGIMKILGRSLESALVALLLVLTGPMIVTLDRGNMQILIAGLFALFCAGILKNNWKVIAISLAIAIAIKAYAAVFILILIRQKRWFELMITCEATLLLFAISFMLIPGSAVSNFLHFLDANISFAGSSNTGVANFASASGLIYKYLLLVLGPTGASNFIEHLPSWCVQIPGIAIAAVCLAILWMSKERVEVGLIAILAMIQLSPVASGSYLELNIAIEICLLLRLLAGHEFAHDFPTTSTGQSQSGELAKCLRVERRILVASVFLLAFGIAPWVFRFGSLPILSTPSGPSSSSTVAFAVMGPTANILCLALLTFVSYRGHTRAVLELRRADVALSSS